MGRREEKKRDTRKNSLLECLNEGEAAIILRRLLVAHPEHDTEAEEIAKTLLRDENFEDIAGDVYDSRQVLGYDELNGRAGRHEWGYVEPGEAAEEILSETVGSLLEDLKRRVDLGLEEEALQMCKGLVLGLYRLDHNGGGELLQWAPEFPAETAAYALKMWSDGARRRQSQHRAMLQDFMNQFVPDWKDTIAIS
jgi:hypothetical protein